jgi:hypothetical protein
MGRFARVSAFAAPCLLSALLLWAAFPPMGETCAVAFALAPMLAVSRLSSPRRGAWSWFAFGMAFWTATLAWMPAIVKNNGPLPLVLLGWFGLAALCARTLGGDVGKALQTIILASSILYELVGPGLAKLSLWLSHSYSNKLEDLAPVPETDENGRVKTEAELLAERIQAIQKSLPPPTLPEENERVFTEEAEEAWRNTWNDVLTRNRERRSKGGPFR